MATLLMLAPTTASQFNPITELGKLVHPLEKLVLRFLDFMRFLKQAFQQQVVQTQLAAVL